MEKYTLKWTIKNFIHTVYIFIGIYMYCTVHLHEIT